MKTKWKVIITLAVLVILGAGVYASTVYSQRGLVTVQTGSVVRQDLTSIVTASGEIKPKNYINIGANAMGDITDLLVREGDHVRKGQLLAKIENTQPTADVETQKANLASAEADSGAAEAGLKAADDNLATMQAAVVEAEADLARTKQDADRATDLYKEKLGARQDVESKTGLYNAQKAAVDQAKARLTQARSQREQTAAQLTSAQRRIAMSKAVLARSSDVLRKYDSYAPLDGEVTDLPVRAGESVVPGLQNQTGTLIMTIADMSLITAEVKVDETDIVNVKIGQQAEITIDAIPNKTFKGHVTDFPLTLTYGKKVDALRRKYKAWLWDADFRDTLGASVTADGSHRYTVFQTSSGKRAVVVVNLESSKAITATLDIPNSGSLMSASPEQPDAKPVFGRLNVPARSAIVVMEQ